MGAHYYAWPLWVMVVLPFVAALLWGIVGRFFCKYRSAWLCVNIALVVAGLILIYWETVAGRTVGSYAEQYGAPSLMPFSSFTREPVDDETFRSMFCNVMLFVPFGAGLANMLGCPRGNTGYGSPVCGWTSRRAIAVTVLVGLAISIVIEAVQYAFGMGMCETDDVIMNGIGMVIGAGSILVVNREK